MIYKNFKGKLIIELFNIIFYIMNINEFIETFNAKYQQNRTLSNNPRRGKYNSEQFKKHVEKLLIIDNNQLILSVENLMNMFDYINQQNKKISTCYQKYHNITNQLLTFAYETECYIFILNYDEIFINQISK